MALPSSGNIDLNMIQDEFGAPRGTGLASFLRGGAWVPDTPINAGVPSSLPIDMRDLLGASSDSDHSVAVSAVNNIGANGILNDTSTATVTGGIGPFTYAWSWSAGGTGITLTNTTNPTVNLESTGTDQQRTGTLRCDVIDTGNGGLSEFGENFVTFTHGTPP